MMEVATRRGARSLKQWLADDIAVQIEQGTLRPGDQLPTVTELCALYGVSDIVVRGAVDWLKARGLVEGVPGVGVFVAQPKQESST
jgi:DNA-binding GntR family transcriptional regulator